MFTRPRPVNLLLGDHGVRHLLTDQTMKLITPKKGVKLGFRAYLQRVGANGHLIAADRNGKVAVLDRDARTIGCFSVGTGLVSVAVSPDGHEALLVWKDRMEIRSSESGDLLRGINGQFRDAAFDANYRLWSAQLMEDDDEVLIQVHNKGNSSDPMECAVKDPFGDSYWGFCFGPSSSCTSIWAAAGQDGQQIIWLHEDEGTLNAEPFEDLDLCGPPRFPTDDDGEFLVTVDFNEVRRYSFPDFEFLGTCSIDQNVDDVEYLTHDWALACGDGFALLIDVVEMKVCDEIEIQGHRKQPTRVLYPRLSDDDPTTDLVSIQKLVDCHFVSTHTELPDPDGEYRSIFEFWTFNTL